MNTHHLLSQDGLHVPSPAPGDLIQTTPLSQVEIDTAGDAERRGLAVRQGGSEVGRLFKNCFGHWIGAPFSADSCVFLEQEAALAYVKDCLGKPPPRYANVHEAEYYAAGMRHVSRGAGLRLHVCLGQDRNRNPLVTLQELIGGAGDYCPADLRTLATKLNAIADDAEAQPMGKRSFDRSYRRY